MRSIALPRGWVEALLGDVARVYSGGTPSRAVSRLWNGDIPWVTTAEIDSVYITASRETITAEGLNASAAKVAEPGTLLLAMYGQGKTRGKVAILRIAASMNQACAAIEAGRGVDETYLLHYLTARYSDIRGMSNAGSQDNLSGDIVKSIAVALPPWAEQRAIAQALSDVDELISALGRLIAKKRDVKQGMMQELLTGRTRLPGFAGEWGECALSGLIDGLVAGTSVRSIDGTTRPAVLKTSAVRGGCLDELEVKAILPEDIPRARCMPVADSIIVSRMNTPAMVGEVGYVERDLPAVYLPDRLWLARARQGAGTNMRWLAALLSFGETAETVRGLATGTSNSMKNIAKDRLLALRVPSPPSREQHAIGSLLADADSEIEALERRLDSARAVKVGMMQELLAGRTRLPVKEEA